LPPIFTSSSFRGSERDHGELRKKLLGLGPSPAAVFAELDTTGGGDDFAGALAARLAGRASLEEAVPYAVLAGAAAMARWGGVVTADAGGSE